MARKTILAPGEFYHIYNRGTDKRKIFSNRADYERFLALLYLANSSTPVRTRDFLRDIPAQGSTLATLLSHPKGEKPIVSIGGYCLMPNHFHMLVQEIEEGGISRFMQVLTTAYTMYFNIVHERSGALFQGRFKATHVDDDRYLSYLISYIHLNPVKIIDPKWKENGIKNKIKAKNYLEKYRYSSYLDYAGRDRLEKVIIDKSALPKYFESPRGFKENTSEWFEFKQVSQGSTLVEKV